MRLPLFAAALLLPALWLFSQDSIQVGYLVVQSDDGSPVPVGTALFSFRNSQDILVSEAGVGAVEPLGRGRIFVDQRGTLTGLAMANPDSEGVVVDLTLRDFNGVVTGQRSEPLGPNAHLPRNVHELFQNLPTGFTGSLTFEVQDGRQIGAVTVRQGFNQQDEPLLATLPVVDLSVQAPASGSLVFPHIGAGTAAGITLATQVILINRTAEAISGQITMVGSNGQSLSLSVDGGTPVSTFNYQLSPNGTFSASLTVEGEARQGYAIVTVDTGSQLPAGTAVFRYTRGAFPVSEAGVAAIPSTTRARIFVDNDETMTGFAVASPDNGPLTVQVSLLDRNGQPLDENTIDLPPNGHAALFANQLFTLEPGFTGILEISATQRFVPITLKFTVNGRGDFILTTLPVADLVRLPQATTVIFPQIGLGPIIGGQFTTRLIFINGDLQNGLAGLLSFFGSDGSGLSVPLAGEVTSQFPYAIPAGTARQYFPGTFADLAEIVLDAQEVTINQGASFQLHPVAIDQDGNQRDDFVFQFSSLAPETIEADQFGRLTALNRGFATISVEARGRLATLVATGATITQGGAAFQVTGVQGDSAGQLYLTNGAEHTVLQAEELTAVPQLWAGIPRNRGLDPDGRPRLESRFDEPSFVAIDQGRARLYVSDAGNSVIRSVMLGETGTVSTFAAGFQSPQGLAIDPAGRLWVADSGDHTIRMVNLDSGTVTLLAGQPGARASVDGVGAAARFDTPTGIALEREPLDQILSRDPGDPEPPITMLVADAGTGFLRRVREDGLVETVTPDNLAGSEAPPDGQFRPAGPTPFRFRNPAGIVVDDFGNVYVSEPGAGGVRLLLRDGQIVQAAQEGTFNTPRQLAIVTRGRVLVAESFASVQEIRYAGPSITSVQPDRISNRGGAMVTVTGNNFARDTLVVLGGQLIGNAQVVNNRTITFVAPALPSGRAVLTLHHRGGLDQADVLIDATPLDELEAGQITTIAGGSNDTGDGRFATRGRFLVPFRAVSDEQGNLYVADGADHRIRRIDAVTTIITTVAGVGRPDFSGDGGPARLAGLNTPVGVAFSPLGDLLIADAGNNAIRSIDAETGIISTVIQNPLSQVPGFEGPSVIWDLAVRDSGEIVGVDLFAHRVFEVDPVEGSVRMLAGNGQAGFNGNGIALESSLSSPQGISLDGQGNVLIADTSNHLIRRLDLNTGLLATLAGTPATFGFGGDGNDPLEALLRFPFDVFADESGRLWIADTGNNRVRLVDAQGQQIETAAGTGTPGFSGDGGDPLAAMLDTPTSLLVSSGEQVFIVDAVNDRIRTFNLRENVLDTYAGSEGVSIGDGELATGASLSFPGGLDFDSLGRLYVTDSNHHRIRRISQPGGLAALVSRSRGLQGEGTSTLQIETIAGTGVAGFAGDGGPAREARLDTPLDVTLDDQDEVLVSDTFNHVVRRIFQPSTASILQGSTTTGSEVIVSIVGTGLAGLIGDGGPANQARLRLPVGITTDPAGNIYVADSGNNRVRRVDAQGTITTLVGSQGGLSSPQDVLFDGEAGLYIADSGNHRVLFFDLSSGGLQTVAGTGQAGFSGDSGSASRARLRFPTALALDLDQQALLISDSGNGRVRQVLLGTGIISTVAGTGGQQGFSGDNAQALEARFNSIAGIEVDPDGNIFICDSNNHRIRAVKGPLP